MMPHKASGHTLDVILERKSHLRRIAQRVLEDCHNIALNKECAFIITDENGWTLSVIAGEKIRHALNILGLNEGSFWGEEQVGTNAFSLSAATNTFCTLSGAEHFCEALHRFAMSASPVIDFYGATHGFVICVEDFPAGETSLPLAYACASEIAGMLYIESELLNSNKVLCQHNAVLECMEDGFICWDEGMVITMINPQAELLLKVKRDEVVGKDVKSLFVFPPALIQAIGSRTKLSQKQIVLECAAEFIELMVTLRPLSDGSFLLFLHPLDKIRKIAQQQISANATFTFDSLHAISRNMKHVVAIARRAMKSKSPILIYGEEGVGKLSLAMAIHNESESTEGPFVSVDCQMLTPENMAHELLGSDEGPAPSKFELAQNGTLYLEKVEYLSSEMQSALLKVLKTGLVMRSDSPRLIPVKFRLVACTGSSLKEYVQQGAFSRQLFYEMSVNEIEIPPLRKRREDLHHMIADLLTKYRDRTGRKLALSDDASEALQNYAWSGNISEFKNRMEKIFLFSNKPLIGLDDIPLDIRQNQETADETLAHIISLEELEMQAIENACRACNWNLSKVANVLKIGRTTLWRKLKTYNLHHKVDPAA